jgi:CBS-domain-containing membrane protein
MLTEELELTDEDVIDAMQHIPGYLDISTDDFRAIYHLAHAHASERLFQQVRAGALMRAGVEPLRPEMSAADAARALVQQNLKSLPVVDNGNQVLGILTETNLLRCLGAASYLELLFDAVEQVRVPDAACGQRSVAEVMTSPAIGVNERAGFNEVMQAFRRHAGRSMPVVDAAGRLTGMLLRKDFLHACHIEDSGS